MKKLLAILLSAMLVFSMVACSNDTPSPQAPVETPTELDKINDKLDSASNAFEDAENIEETIDESTGTVTQTIKEAVSMDGYTITSGKKTVSKDGLTASTALTIEYEENGQNVQIQDTQSEKVTVTNADGSDVSLEEEEIKEVTAAALTTAKEIPASQFVRTGENEYTYTPASTMARLARTGESVSKVVISFTYEDSKAVYTYEVTYITAGNTLTVTQEVSKETKKSVLNEETGEYEESNDEVKDNLMNDFSLGNLQPGGNSFYREEALDAAYILRDGGIDVPYYGFTPTDYTVTDSNKDTITIRNGSGAAIILNVTGFSTEHITYDYYNGASTSDSQITQTVIVDSFDIDIPFISDYVKAGDQITLEYKGKYKGKYENDGSSSTVTITVKDSTAEKLVAKFDETSTYIDESKLATADDLVDVYKHRYNTTVEFTLTDKIKDEVLAAGIIVTTDNQEDTHEYEIDANGNRITKYPTQHSSTSESKVTFNTLTITELRDLFGVGEADTLVIETEQTSSHEENEFHEIINEKTETTITVNDEAFDYSTLIEKLLGNAEGLIDFVNSGLSLEYDGTTQPSKYDAAYDVFNSETGEFIDSVDVHGITRIETTDFTLNIKKGAVDRLVELLEAMMGGNGSMPNVNPNDFGSGNMVFTRDYTFDSSFFGAKGVKFVEITPMSASMPTYRIEFKDGYMKGAYTFTEEELWNNNMYY